MHISHLTVLATLAASTAAFKGASPFFIASTSESPLSISSQQIQSSESVWSSAQTFLDECPTDVYLLLSQAHTSSSTIPASLRTAYTSMSQSTRASVNQVVDGLDAQRFESYLHTKCGAQVVSSDSVTFTQPKSIINLHLASDSTSSEQTLAQILTSLKAGQQSYTLIYTTTPASASTDNALHPAYESEFQEPMHVEMKRQTAREGRGFVKRANHTVSDKAPLFEKYQFFTPGLFMGILISLLLLAILSVALRALSSLSVSYGAFDKEMGPAAQKKAV